VKHSVSQEAVFKTKSKSKNMTIEANKWTLHFGWFGLVYLFIHSVTHITLDTSVTDYNLYITT